MRSLIKSQRGFTFIELVVGLALAGIIGSLMMVSLSQFMRITDEGSDELSAFHALENAAHWLSRDVQSAAATDLVDGGPPVSSVTLTWTDQYGGANTAHTSTYALVGTDLRRNYDGALLTVARNISSIGFSLNGKVLTVDITSAPPGAVTERKVYSFTLRTDTLV